MYVESEASYLDLDAVARRVCQSPQRKVSYPLDRDAGEGSQDSENDKGRQVEEHEDSEDEGRVEESHRDAGALAREGCAP